MMIWSVPHFDICSTVISSMSDVGNVEATMLLSTHYEAHLLTMSYEGLVLLSHPAWRPLLAVHISIQAHKPCQVVHVY